MRVRESLIYEHLPSNVVRCKICPRMCYIKPREKGFCRVRVNDEGKLYLLTYGALTAMNADPVEKKPLFHFWPGSKTFSISSVSCSFRCPWCQNWEISQAGPWDVGAMEVSPEQVVKLTRRYGCRSISYTYNEPIIWYEFVLDCAKLAKREGLPNILVTNGYISSEALEELSPYIDAANVDIKSFNKQFYRVYCKANLDDVLKATELMVEMGIHVELTNLIIPGLNDKMDEIEEMAEWILKTLGPNTPTHFSRFYPLYKMSHLSATPASTLVKAAEVARKIGLHYVYVGNIPGHSGENTYCPTCHEQLIGRCGFAITKWNLTNEMRCPKCCELIPIKGKYEERGTSFPRIF
ncbi:MAG: AmmeMemoRadiSam system radical SAM enzyme [Candidatus Bathyarchaeia archaeon]